MQWKVRQLLTGDAKVDKDKIVWHYNNVSCLQHHLHNLKLSSEESCCRRCGRKARKGMFVVRTVIWTIPMARKMKSGTAQGNVLDTLLDWKWLVYWEREKGCQKDCCRTKRKGRPNKSNTRASHELTFSRGWMISVKLSHHGGHPIHSISL